MDAVGAHGSGLSVLVSGQLWGNLDELNATASPPADSCVLTGRQWAALMATRGKWPSFLMAAHGHFPMAADICCGPHPSWTSRCESPAERYPATSQ